MLDVPNDLDGGRGRCRRRRVGRTAACAVALIGVVVVSAACENEAQFSIPYDDYVVGLGAICTSATERLMALPSAPDQISVADLATSAAEILDDEATRAERLPVPDPGADVPVDDLAGDHRAFVRNTREQADAWRSIGAAEDLAAATELVAQLVGGRNELVRQMGVEACTRGGL